MAFLNVNTPLKNLKTGDYFYPLTNLDQIITGNNRLSAFLSEDNSNHNLLNLSNIGNLSVNGTAYFNGQVTATQFNGPLNGNATSATKLVYGPVLDSDAAINSFHTANTFQAALWNNTSSPGTGNGIILDMGWTNAAYGAQLAIDDDPNYFIALRQRDGNGWKAWKRIPMGDGTGASGTWGISITGNAATANYLNINNSANLANGLQYIQTSSQNSGKDLPSSTWWHVIKMNHGTGDTYYKRLLAFDFWTANNIQTAVATNNGVTRSWYKVWCQGNSVTGAVWNDYAECRKSDSQEPGYVMFEKGDDSLSKTIERLQHFAGIVSDTWGFSQGETDEAKTNIAVAGRVLAYPYQDRNNYKPGDCVCAAPGGKVDIMTREEIIQYPDRIVGTVSCVPDYEEWGGGELADRDPVKVNGRIWIKVR